MSVKARTFKELKTEKSLQDFNHFAKKLTELYATSELEYTQADIARDNHLSSKCLRQLMDYAIEETIVCRKICEQVSSKSKANQQRKIQTVSINVIKHHENLIKKREEFIAKSFSRVKVNEIAKEFANNPSKPIKYFTNKNDIESERITKLLLKRAIIENIVEDEVMELIIKRSLGDNPSYKATEAFEKFREEREKYKNSQ